MRNPKHERTHARTHALARTHTHSLNEYFDLLQTAWILNSWGQNSIHETFLLRKIKTMLFMDSFPKKPSILTEKLLHMTGTPRTEQEVVAFLRKIYWTQIVFFFFFKRSSFCWILLPSACGRDTVVSTVMIASVSNMLSSSGSWSSITLGWPKQHLYGRASLTLRVERTFLHVSNQSLSVHGRCEIFVTYIRDILNVQAPEHTLIWPCCSQGLSLAAHLSQ